MCCFDIFMISSGDLNVSVISFFCSDVIFRLDICGLARWTFPTDLDRERERCLDLIFRTFSTSSFI